MHIADHNIFADKSGHLEWQPLLTSFVKEIFFRMIKVKACTHLRSDLDDLPVWSKNINQVSAQHESFAHTLKLLLLVVQFRPNPNPQEILLTGLVLYQ